MVTTELRINNLIEFEGKKCSVREIDANGMRLWFEEDGEDEWIDIFQLSSIPLTEEWLVKFGFVKMNDLLLYSKKFPRNLPYALSVYKYQDEQWVASLTWTKRWDDVRSVILPMTDTHEYVHKLQNLWYALTNEELKIENI